MANLSVNDQDGGQLDKAQVVGAVFLPTGPQAPEAVEPAVTHLDHPAPRRMAVRVAGGGQGPLDRCLGRDVRRIPPRDRRVAARLVIISPVQHQMGRIGRGRRDHDGIQQLGQFLHIVPIGPGHDDGHGNALGLGQEVALRAGFPPIGGVASRGLRVARPPF